MTTETQEFLEYLTDPTQANLNKAIREFKEAHGKQITEVLCWRMGNTDEWRIEMQADEHGPLLALSELFCQCILRYMPSAKINQDVYVAQEGQVMYKTYRVVLR